MARPLVSVVIPTYNCAMYLAESIDSAVGQDFAEKEIIIVDDGSTDNTKEILARFKDKIRYIYQENSGASSARNRAVAESRGKYIAFLDADDVWLPGKLKKQVEFFQRQPRSVKLTYTDWEYCFDPFDRHSLLTLKISGYEGNVARQLFCHDFIPTPTVMVEKDFLSSLGAFDRSLVVAEDYDMWLRASTACEFRFLPAVLALVRMRSRSLTRLVPTKTCEKAWIAVRHKFLQSGSHFLSGFPLWLWKFGTMRARVLAIHLYTFSNSGMVSKDLRSIVRYLLMSKLDRTRRILMR